MSMLRSLESTEHARQRFLNTVVLTEAKVPVLISSIEGDWSARCLVLETNKMQDIKDIRVGGIIATPVPLGFCQVGKEAVYLARKPSRRSRQGLDLDDLSITHTVGIVTNFGSTTARKGLAKTILGEFCKFNDAVKSVLKEEKSMAFHRDWAISNAGEELDNISLIYKFFGRCGTLEDGKVRLFNNFSYLRETLEEDVGNVHV